MKKVLIIGHNVFDESTAYGKTLSSFFCNWDPDKLAQLYFHSEIPTSRICSNYYRLTDKDILKSIFQPFRKKVGTSFSVDDIKDDGRNSRIDVGIEKKIYSFGRKRTSSIYIARNLIWKFGHVKNIKLIDWLIGFSPEVIFCAAGDYAFAYNVIEFVANLLKIPVVMYCCDDYFINRLNPNSILSKFVYKNLMKAVNKVVSHTSAMITICDKMTEAYQELFDIPVHTVYTGYSHKGERTESKDGIVYLGNLGFSRYQSLVDIGRALQRFNKQNGTEYWLDVYSTENRKFILEHLTENNGIRFHGAVNQDYVKRIISDSLLVIHTESFSEENIYKTKYSISTKIADLLASGHCILAYGPKSIASIDYLAENSAGIVIDDPDNLDSLITKGINDVEWRNQLIENANNLAEKNHNPFIVSEKITKIIDSSRR